MAKEAKRPIHLETIRVDRASHRIDVAISASPMYDPQGVFIGVAAVMRDITDRKKAELHQRLLIGELNHRVKNTLAVIQGLAQQTFKNVEGARSAQTAFEGRLLALASAHNVLTERRWENASFREIIVSALRPFAKAGEGRANLEGPDFLVRPQVAVSFAMVFHELATNAVKYGALNSDGGSLDIGWSVDEQGSFGLLWMEHTIEPVKAPSSVGFGSKLIARTLKAEIGARVTTDYHAEGLRLEISAPDFRVPSAGHTTDSEFGVKLTLAAAQVGSQ
jgi:two-component sensor histidine kinase